MSLFSIEVRELRSFRIRHRIQNLRFFIENSNINGAFCIANSLHPIEREELRSDFNKNNIVVTSLSKNIIRFLFINSKWKIVRNLLEGEIFLIRSKSNVLLKKDYLLSLIKPGKFFLRLLIQNNELYRNQHLTLLLNKLGKNKNDFLVLFYLKQFLFEYVLFITTRRLNLNKIKNK